MAVPQQQPVGGLGAMAPKPQGAPPPEPSEAKDAARISSMEQDQPDTPANMMDRAIQKQREAARALEAQTALLRQSYDARMNLPFDTSLMAAAAGFLKPTKTGSFGESAGYAAEAYAADAEKAQLRKQQAEKQKMELAQQEMAMGTKNLEFEHMLQMAGYNPANATKLTGGAGAPSPTAMPSPAGGAPSGGAPIAGGAPRPASAPANVGQSGAPNELPMISDRDITTAYAISKDHGDKIAAIAKMQREDLIVNEGNVFSKSQKKFLDVTPPNEKAADFNFGPAGDRKTTPDVYREYKQIIASGTDDQLRDFFIRQRWLAGTPSGAPRIGSAGTAPAGGAAPAGATPSVGGATPAGKPPAGGFGLPSKFKTAEELAQEKMNQETALAENKKYAEAAGEMANDLRLSAFSATDIKALAQEAGSIAKAAAPAFKLLMNKDDQFRNEFDAYMQMAKTGAQAGQFGSFSIPTDIIERNGLTSEQIQALQKFAQIEAQFTLFNRRLWLKGQGAISNGESTVAAQLGPQASDRPEVIQMKAQAIERKADFDEQTFMAFEQWRENNPNGGFSKFISQSPEFKALKTEYIADLKAMRDANAKYFAGPKKPATTTTPAAPPAVTPTPVPAESAPKPAAKPPANENPVDRFKREKAERERAAQGNQ